MPREAARLAKANAAPLSAVVVEARRLSEVWEQSLHQLVVEAEGELPFYSSTGGDFYELQNVLLVATTPDEEPQVSAGYHDTQTVSDFRLQTRGRGRRPHDAETIGDQIYRWRSGPSRPINQFKEVLAELSTAPNSRRAVIAIWDPAYDLVRRHEVNPRGHCFLYFALREGALAITVVSRSVDAWNGAVPNMVAFASVQADLATKLDVVVGTFTQHIFSYHLYRPDLLAARRLLGVDPERRRSVKA